MKIRKLINAALLITVLGLFACEADSNFLPDEQTKDNQITDTDDSISKITFTTSKSAGATIALEIFADKAHQKDVWIDLNNNGKKDEGEEITQFQNRDTKRPANYTIQSQTITLYGKVTYFNCRQNDITKLDVTQNPNLLELSCGDNQLDNIDLSKNAALEFLDITGNQLTELDVTNNPELINLWCLLNQLKSLDLSRNKALKYLNCSENKLTSLDVSNNENLIMLHYNVNPMVVDISKNSKLENLGCSQTKVTDNFDLSNQPNLLWLFCCSNDLSSIDVSHNKKMTLLDCSGNKIEKLDVSHNINLESLHCHDNQLESLDVSKNMSLLYVECQDNKMDVAGINAFFESLRKVSDVKPEQSFHKTIQMKGNPGNWDAETPIALNKGWRVYF